MITFSIFAALNEYMAQTFNRQATGTRLALTYRWPNPILQSVRAFLPGLFNHPVHHGSFPPLDSAPSLVSFDYGYYNQSKSVSQYFIGIIFDVFYSDSPKTVQTKLSGKIDHLFLSEADRNGHAMPNKRLDNGFIYLIIPSFSSLYRMRSSRYDVHSRSPNSHFCSVR